MAEDDEDALVRPRKMAIDAEVPLGWLQMQKYKECFSMCKGGYFTARDGSEYLSTAKDG